MRDRALYFSTLSNPLGNLRAVLSSPNTTLDNSTKVAAVVISFLAKLGVGTRTAAATYAVRHGLV
jgi:hypothetical protein